MTTPAGQMEMEMQRQKGFTLIELVVVIVILGVLAAVALPRFMNATEDAHTAAVSGTGGALAAGVALVRSQWELNRVKGDTTPNVDVQGFGEGLMDVNNSGWPMATGITGTGTVPTTPSDAQCVEIWSAVLQGSAPSVGDATMTLTTPDYRAAATTVSSNPGCLYTYTLDGRTAASRTITYNTVTGAVTTKAD
ncbi:Type II secretion system protein G precursor [compost metagenome]